MFPRNLRVDLLNNFYLAEAKLLSVLLGGSEVDLLEDLYEANRRSVNSAFSAHSTQATFRSKFSWLKRLRERVPLQYITSTCFWRDLTLVVSPAVLIPRPETGRTCQKRSHYLSSSVSRPLGRFGHWFRCPRNLSCSRNTEDEDFECTGNRMLRKRTSCSRC